MENEFVYLGKMNWYDATEKCVSLGMRLPTVDELNTVHEEKKFESWIQEGIYYWTSNELLGVNAYIFNVVHGYAFDYSKNSVRHVRGIR